jgi:hypothetical protein
MNMNASIAELVRKIRSLDVRRISSENQGRQYLVVVPYSELNSDWEKMQFEAEHEVPASNPVEARNAAIAYVDGVCRAARSRHDICSYNIDREKIRVYEIEGSNKIDVTPKGK